jgi:hypothetical protein
MITFAAKVPTNEANLFHNPVKLLFITGTGRIHFGCNNRIACNNTGAVVRSAGAGQPSDEFSR